MPGQDWNRSTDKRDGMTVVTPLPAFGLYAITLEPESGSGSIQLTSAVQAALSGGATMIQYRAKQRPRDRKAADLRDLLPLCRAAKAPLIVNDDVDLAAETDADGIHIGEYDEALAAARQRLGKSCIIGVSCYDSLQRARDAVGAGASYVAFGSFYPTATKVASRRAAITLLHQAQAEGIGPIAAIGGITHDNAPPLLAGGAQYLAVISAVFCADDIRAAAIGFSRLFHGRSNHKSPAE